MTAATVARAMAGPDPELVKGIRRAGRAAGVDFGYLMAQAAQESGFRADAKARTSSASGLYQFVEGTWLDLVRRHGAAHGIDADAPRAELLALREDPALAASMAAEYARENKKVLEAALGRETGRGALALAHFLGPGGAIRFLEGLDANADTAAAALLPAAASANRAVFYKSDGAPRSLGEIWQDFSRRIEREAASWTERAGNPVGMPAENITAAAEARPAGGNALASSQAAADPLPPAGRAPAMTLGAPRLSRPTLAMLDALAFAALKLVGQPSPAATREDARTEGTTSSI
jgi:hypothetical protein